MIFESIIEKVNAASSGYWSKRIVAQIDFAQKLSVLEGDMYRPEIELALELMNTAIDTEGVLSKTTCLQVEHALAPVAESAKKLQLLCVSHAHIDMNWQWSYAETTAITLDTLRTVLLLLEEYPEFTFAQSQASVYEIVEKYDPVMLEKIKRYVKEGRWEVSASTWVEGDKNMPSGESQLRHLLYTKRYLSQLLDIDSKTLNLDFEPDTFGHSANVPEILRHAGVSYYYHCRGAKDRIASRWKSPSGASVVSYCEPFWYNWNVDETIAQYVPAFCSQYGVNTALRVYGIGDHGGGPTRRDIERIRDMMTWPIFPTICFGTYRSFFTSLEKGKLPVYTGEMNPVFTGCYTTQTRIKQANKVMEIKLEEAESFMVMSSLFTGKTGISLESAWRTTLFNQFHDIITGSGKIDTREYAMGKFQDALTLANTTANQALRAIVAQIDTSSFTSDAMAWQEVSEGGGVGYGLVDFNYPQAERGVGKTRVYHLFNSRPVLFSGLAEISVWDWPGNVDRIKVQDSFGNAVGYQYVKQDDYWGHHYFSLLIEVSISPCGYSTYILSENTIATDICFPADPRVHAPLVPVLENEYIRVSFDLSSLAIVSFLDKKTGKELAGIDSCQGNFRLVAEDSSQGMTSWIIGEYSSIQTLSGATDLQVEHGTFRQSIRGKICFSHSILEVCISLDKEETCLKYDLTCDWREMTLPGETIPQLNFYVPLSQKLFEYLYDVPLGTLQRPSANIDFPATNYIAAIGTDDIPGVVLASRDKYGFRGTDSSLAVTLIRSSRDPDIQPEVSLHRISMMLGSFEGSVISPIVEHYRHTPVAISALPHPGSLPLAMSAMELTGNGVVSAIKISEESLDSSERQTVSVILRLYETEGKCAVATMYFQSPILSAQFVDVHENPVEKNTPVLSGNKLDIPLEPNCVASVKIVFSK
jgi:alpha-mannosidase